MTMAGADACETNKADCLEANSVLPGRIAEACAVAGVPWGHVSSGCIYDGPGGGGAGFREEDPPNFTFHSGRCSFYSGTKALEHTCFSGLHPSLRADYRRGIDRTLRSGGLLIGVWFINPDLDPGEEGPPFPLSLADLTALCSDGYETVEDYVPNVSFKGREGRERVRVLRRVGPG
jgi:hypothetical protein